MYIFPIIAAAVSFVFAAQLFNQYLSKRKPHQLVWAVAMSMFGLASLVQTIGVLSDWTELLAKTWYLFGAVLVVGYLALGTLYIQQPSVGRWLVVGAVIASIISTLPMIIFSEGVSGASKTQALILYGLVFAEVLVLALVAKEHVAKIWLANLLIGTVAGIVMLMNSPVDSTRIAMDGWEAIERSPFLKGLVISINFGGTVVLVGGAFHSGWTLFRKGIMRNLAIGTSLIAAGALICASGSTIHGYFNIAGPAALSISLTVGIIVMFIGFLQTGRPSPQVPAKPPVEAAKTRTEA